MFFFIKEKLDSKGKISIFYEISEKYPRFQRMPMQKCHKIFVQIFPFQNILHLFLKKKTYFVCGLGDAPPPPPFTDRSRIFFTLSLILCRFPRFRRMCTWVTYYSVVFTFSTCKLPPENQRRTLEEPFSWNQLYYKFG